MFSRKVVLLLALPLLVITALAWSPGPATRGAEAAQRGAEAAQAGPAAPAACTVPTTATIRGKAVEFDQCYERTFSHGGSNYTIHTFYTEQNSTTNLNQCDGSDAPGRCEHALSDNDDGNGDNVNAVAATDEVEMVLRYYIDRSISPIPATQMNVYIAEDPRLGWILGSNGFWYDDDTIDNNDDLWKRALAIHEMQHMVQEKHWSMVGWIDFYGEGIARASEDRVDAAQDADTGHLFLPEVDGILGSNSNRTSDLSTISYRSVLWWTWLMDQYRTGGESEPGLGWNAIDAFYDELATESDQMKAVRDFITAQGSNFADDFIDYTLSLYAYRFNPGDGRLGFLDTEITNNTSGLSGHSVFNSGPAFTTSSVTMNPRSSRYWEFNPASACDFIGYTFDGNGKEYGFSVMTVDGGTLQQRWTSRSSGWARTVRTAGLDRIVGVVSAADQSGTVDVGYGCVEPTLTIKNPTSSLFEMVGTADNPRNFIVRLHVEGADGAAVAGLVASDFEVSLTPAGGGAALPASVVSSTYVQDDYWLLVAPPDDSDGAVSGQFYHLTATLGSESDTNNNSVVYIKRTQDVVVVLDRSFSMNDANKIGAAKDASNLLVNELADDDQGAFVVFSDDADVREQLAPVGSGAGSHRQALETAISNETLFNLTAIGDGMNAAATEHDARGIADNLCSFVLLSDGYETDAAYWVDVQAAVVDNGCAIHTIALGPQANELLLQQIAASVPGGSYDYADSQGDVPLAPAGLLAPTDTLPWSLYLSRVYDDKMTEIAARQRLQTATGGRDDQEGKEYTFFVDETAQSLVISIAWTQPTKGEQMISLIDPDGNPVTPDAQRISSAATNEVWEVEKPAPGKWTLRVGGLFQPYFVSITSQSNYQLYGFAGAPQEGGTAGLQVPILASFTGPDKPLTGATIEATIQAPTGQVTLLPLYDDGNHGDGQADDGVYGNLYSATSAGDADPNAKVVENEEPAQGGSYIVNFVGTWNEIRREAQTSFALYEGEDLDGDRLPDAWEREYGVDEPEGDDDRDKLINVCEFRTGTNPQNPDTDGGGESDGSEVPDCTPAPGGQNPFDPADDRVGPITWLHAVPWLDAQSLRPEIRVTWGTPLWGTLLSVDLYRRTEGGEWTLLAAGLKGNQYTDRSISAGTEYEYLLLPAVQADNSTFLAPAISSNRATPKADPFAPGGSVLINDGAPTTDSPLVTLSFAVDDSGPGHDSFTDVPGSPVGEIEMRISNSPEFGNTAWRPFQEELAWDLGNVRPGDTAVVYVQFRDGAGNVSESGMGQMDSIVLEGDQLYLPVIIR